MKVERLRVSSDPKGPSLTKQADAHAADVNNIVGQFLKTGDPASLMVREGQFADVSNFGDYLSCLNTVRTAETAFAALPAKIRDRFKNDPTTLMEAILDPAQTAALVELGVIEAQPITEPTPSTSTSTAEPLAPPAPPTPEGTPKP